MPSVRQRQQVTRETRRPRPKDAALPQSTQPKPHQLELVKRRPARRGSFSEATRLRNLEHTRELKSLLADIVSRREAS